MVHLEHVGIAVHDAETVTRLFKILFGLLPYKTESVEREGVETVFIPAGQTKIELLKSLGPNSPVGKYLDKRGPGIHHLAFEVPDIHVAYERIVMAGFSPLSDAPLKGADNKLIFFLHPKETAGVLIELCQQTPPHFLLRRVEGSSFGFFEAGSQKGITLLVLPPYGPPDRSGGESLFPLMNRLQQDFHTILLERNPDYDANIQNVADPALPRIMEEIEDESLVVLAMGRSANLVLRHIHEVDKRVTGVAFHAPYEPRFDAASNWPEIPAFLSLNSDFPSISWSAVPAFREYLGNPEFSVFSGSTAGIESEHIDYFARLLTLTFSQNPFRTA